MSEGRAQALRVEVEGYLRAEGFTDPSGLLDVDVTTGFDDSSVMVALDPRSRLCAPCRADRQPGSPLKDCGGCRKFREEVQGRIAELLPLLGRVLSQRFTLVGGHPGDEQALAYHVVQENRARREGRADRDDLIDPMANRVIVRTVDVTGFAAAGLLLVSLDPVAGLLHLPDPVVEVTSVGGLWLAIYGAMTVLLAKVLGEVTSRRT